MKVGFLCCVSTFRTTGSIIAAVGVPPVETPGGDTPTSPGDTPVLTPIIVPPGTTPGSPQSVPLLGRPARPVQLFQPGSPGVDVVEQGVLVPTDQLETLAPETPLAPMAPRKVQPLGETVQPHGPAPIVPSRPAKQDRN